MTKTSNEKSCQSCAAESLKDTSISFVSYRIEGMDCADEIAAIRKSLSAEVDTETLRFDLINGTMDVPAQIKSAQVLEAVRRAGMSAALVDTKKPDTGHEKKTRLRNALTLLSGLGVALGFGLHAAQQGLLAAVGSEGMGVNISGHELPAVVMLFYGVGVASGLLLVLPKAWFAIKNGRLDMNVLMVLAVSGAMALGEWFEAGTVAFLFSLSLTLESWSVGRAKRAVEKLLSLAPPTARIKGPLGPQEVDPSDVAVGTIFIVNPGERLPLDGVVVDGSSDMDLSPITGESEWVLKEVGDEVFAGTINGNGSLEIKSTRPAADTTLARITRMVGEARKDRSNSERWVEKFSKVYTPVVFMLAGATAVISPVFFGGEWGVWVYRALVLLVIGCPCALVIATPVAIVAGLASAARRGVLVKGGRFLEIPASIVVVALDKTGTLTEGKPKVVKVEALLDFKKEDLLAAVAGIEARSEHPIARAIVEHAQSLNLKIPAADKVQIVPGKGTSGEVKGKFYWLGSHRWLEEKNLENEELHRILQSHSQAGHSIVVVGNKKKVCGYITLADTVRADSAAMVKELHQVGIKRVVMLTGDNKEAAKSVAAELGIDDVRAELLPEEKVQAVDYFEKEYGPVAMIGDGINDAPALARASMGIAMGKKGTDVAVETADVALISDDISKLAWLIKHSSRTLKIIFQNTVFALSVKALFVILAFLNLASLWGAIAADMGASLLVVFNALRLLGKRN